jgi:hypothetical protein
MQPSQALNDQKLEAKASPTDGAILVGFGLELFE